MRIRVCSVARIPSEDVLEAVLMFVDRNGTIAPTTVADHILEGASDVIEYVSDLAQGGPVFEFTSGNRRIGHVIVGGVDIDASERRAEQLAAAWRDGLEWIDRG